MTGVLSIGLVSRLAYFRVIDSLLFFNSGNEFLILQIKIFKMVKPKRLKTVEILLYTYRLKVMAKI